MPTKDGFSPDHPLPLVLADQIEQQGIGILRDRTVTPLRVFKTGVLVAIATATGIAALSVRDPVALFADVTASLVGNSGLQPGTDQSTPTIQSTADAPALVQPAAEAQALPPTAQDAPTRDEIAASEPAAKDETEKSEPSSDALFRQFQAWAVEKDAKAQDEPAQPVQDAPAQAVKTGPAQVAENPRVSHRFVQKHRHVLPVRDARAEMRTQNRRQVRRAQNARVERPPVDDARAQVQPVQNAQAPSFLPSFGLRN
ncbi:MAG: hypothetical protein ACREDY_20155 [Bradyrhizobium sp.]